MASERARLVGRRVELTSIERLVASQGRSGGHFVAVSGEPGIGKTRLLEELATLAVETNCLVLEGCATEFEQQVPFAPFVDALDDYVGSLHPLRLESLGRERLAELARAFPSLAELGDQLVTLEAERYRLHRAVRALLELLGAPSQLVLVLDDVHWADAASLELVLHLLRHPPAGQVLIALAFRPAQVDPALATQLASARADVTAIELRALTEAETAELLGGSLPPERLQLVFEESGGNPFFAQQIARALREEPSSGRGASDVEDIPGTVMGAIEAELARLAPRARLFLQGAAVAGDPFDLWLAAAAADLGVDESRQLLDVLLHADLVRKTAAPTRFRFRHPVVRRTVYAATAGGWRLGAHARTAVELERRGAPPSLRAHHVERSARPGDRAAIAVLDEAARAAAPRAPATAARWHEASLALTPADAIDERLRLSIALSEALAAAGDLRRAGERVADALALVAPGNVELYVQLVALAAGIDSLLGRTREAHARLVSALASLPEGNQRRIALQIDLVRQSAYAGEISPESVRATQAIAHFGVIQNPELRAGAAATLALSAAMRGDTAAWRPAVTTAAATIDSLDETRVARCLEAALFLGGAEWWLGEHQRAEQHLRRALAISRATGQGRFLVPILTNLAISQAAQGRVRQAHQNTQDAVATARLAGTPHLLIWALTDSCLVETEFRGDVRAGFPLGEELCALVAEVGLTHLGAAGLIYHAGSCLEVGEPERCLALLREAEPQRVGLGLLLQLMAEERRVRALLALDRRDDAAKVVDRLHGLADTGEVGLQGSLPCRARATLLLAEGAPIEAARHALAALKHCRRNPVEEARCRLLAGRAFRAACERQRALAELERAHRELEACGADGFRDEAARELRQLGRRVVRRRTDSARGAERGALSRREFEVAELVAQGRTNKQIAATLFVSESTVEKHVARVLEKLGVSRRAAVAAGLARRASSRRPDAHRRA